LVNNTSGFNFTDAAGTSILNIDTSNQRVGIGVAASAKLHIHESSTAASGAIINTQATSSSYFSLDVRSGGTSRLYVRADGNIGIGTTSPSSLLTVGSTGGFQVDSSGNIIKIRGVTYSWPVADGTAGQVLTTNGAGQLSWTTVSGGGTPGGTDGAVQFNSAGGFGGDAGNFFWDNTNKMLGVGISTPSARIHSVSTSEQLRKIYSCF